MATIPAPPEVPAPPDIPDLPTDAPAIRPAFVGVAAVLTWFVGAFVASRILGVYPLTLAKVTLYSAWVPFGVIAWALAAKGHRANGWATALVAALVPIILVTTVPGIRRPTQYPIPGGGSYAFSAAPHGTFHLFLIRDGNGAHPIQLTDHSWPDLYPELSPDGTKIVYSSGGGRSVLELRLMTIDGAGNVVSDQTLVHADVDASDAAWTSGGTGILFIEAIGGLDTLMRTDLQGDVQAVVRSVSNPAPAPDGTQMALSWSGGIWVAGLDGVDPKEIIHTGGVDYWPRWSSDGGRIAFTQIAGADEDVFVGNADGTGVTDLTPGTPGSRDAAFAWTPDGHILFTSNRSNTGGTFIYSMAADGSDVRLVNID